MGFHWNLKLLILQGWIFQSLFGGIHVILKISHHFIMLKTWIKPWAKRLYKVWPNWYYGRNDYERNGTMDETSCTPIDIPQNPTVIDEKKPKSTFYIVLSLINLDLITIFSTLFKEKLFNKYYHCSSFPNRCHLQIDTKKSGKRDYFYFDFENNTSGWIRRRRNQFGYIYLLCLTPLSAIFAL
jgi:hypothetical protein